jgi:hypothetical protein
VLAHDELVVLVQRGDIADNRTIKVCSRELGFKFRFERALFAALELPRSERVRVVITLGSVASWAARTRVSRRTWPSAVLGPGLALTIGRLTVTRPRLSFAIASWACRTITGFGITRPRLALTVTLRTVAAGTRRAVAGFSIAGPRLALAVGRFTIARPRLALTITRRACRAVTRFAVTRPRLALAVTRRSTATGRTTCSAGPALTARSTSAGAP